MRYRWYHLVLDLFGMCGIGLAVAYYFWSHHLPDNQKDQELFSLWANIATEMVGIWLSVRLIDYFLNAERKERSSRLHTVRNMRFLLSQLRRAIEFPGRLEIDFLKRELRWSRDIFQKRSKHFGKDEIRDVTAFFDQLDTSFPRLEKLRELRESYFSGATKEPLDKEQNEFWESITIHEEAQRTAERNILAETDEE